MLATTQVGEVLMLDTATTVHLLCGTRLTNCTNCAARVNPITGKPSPVTPTARLVINELGLFNGLPIQVLLYRLFEDRDGQLSPSRGQDQCSETVLEQKRGGCYYFQLEKTI